MPEGELISVTIGEGIKKFSELGRHDNSNDDKSKYKKVCVGDIAYNSMRMWQGASGYSPYEGIVSPAYTVLSPITDVVDSKCISYLFKRSDMTHVFQMNSQGITSDNWNLKYPALSEIEIMVSPYLAEQHKIAAYLSRIDNLITLQQRKCDKLVNVKKSMLEKMFPREGAKVPEIRFEGFTDDWEQRKVSEVAEVIGGGTPSTSNPEYWDGDINWYAPAEIGEQIYVESSERKITKLGLEKSSAKILPAHKTVLFTSRAGIGNTAILRTPAATNQGFQSMVLNDDINPYFVYSMTYMIKAKAERVASGSTFAEISGKMLGNLEFMFPSKPEQDKIGGYFESLDNLITLQQRKLEKLKNIKKSMLEKMFV